MVVLYSQRILGLSLSLSLWRWWKLAYSITAKSDYCYAELISLLGKNHWVEMLIRLVCSNHTWKLMIMKLASNIAARDAQVCKSGLRSGTKSIHVDKLVCRKWFVCWGQNQRVVVCYDRLQRIASLFAKLERIYVNGLFDRTAPRSWSVKLVQLMWAKPDRVLMWKNGLENWCWSWWNAWQVLISFVAIVIVCWYDFFP